MFKINGDNTISPLDDRLRPDWFDGGYNFGFSVAIDGDYIVVGAYRDDGADNSKPNSSGAVYVFEINGDDTISSLDPLRRNDLDGGDYFGSSVAISGDYIVVGAYGDDGAGNTKGGSGAAYVFKGVE